MRHQEKESGGERQFLTEEQDQLLDLYLSSLDAYLQSQKNAEQFQIEIETRHLKKILSA